MPEEPTFSRAPKEMAALLRRVLKPLTVAVDNVEYEGVFRASEMVKMLMQHRKLTRADSIAICRVLLRSGYIARVGSVTQSGFSDSPDHLYSMIVLPDLASRRGGASLDYGMIQWQTGADQPFKELDIRSMVATVVGSGWRYDYKSSSAYLVYFIHLVISDSDKYTIRYTFFFFFFFFFFLYNTLIVA
jgi:hypothetical protein